MRNLKKLAALFLAGALMLTMLAGCSGNSAAAKKAVEAALKAATAENYDVEINDDLSQRATAILQEYVRDRDNMLYDVTDDEAYPVEIYLGDNESYGTIVFVMPERASDPQT